ncbi:hypothetical protein ACFX2H_004634 [Malus domestica]
MGDPLGSSHVSSQKQNHEGVVRVQSGQYRATVVERARDVVDLGPGCDRKSVVKASPAAQTKEIETCCCPKLLMMAWLSSTIWVCEWKEGDRQCLGVKAGWGAAVAVDEGLDFFFLEKRDLNLKIGGILWVFEFEN